MKARGQEIQDEEAGRKQKGGGQLVESGIRQKGHWR